MHEIPITNRIAADPRHVPVRIRRREEEDPERETEEEKRRRRPPDDQGHLVDIEI
jgi:hypothetical protein